MGLTPVDLAAIGGMSGTLEVCLMQPTVAFKNAIQEGRPMPLNPIHMYRGLGVRANSRGSQSEWCSSKACVEILMCMNLYCNLKAYNTTGVQFLCADEHSFCGANHSCAVRHKLLLQVIARSSDRSRHNEQPRTDCNQLRCRGNISCDSKPNRARCHSPAAEWPSTRHRMLHLV